MWSCRLRYLLPLFLISILTFAQDNPQKSTAPGDKVPVISGDLGECTADLLVKDVKDKPLYNAKIELEIKYGFGGFHRSALEIYTNVDGRARFEGLPRKSRGPLAFTATYEGRSTTVVVEPRDNCHGAYTAILPNKPLPKDEEESE
jgi:hypothetical protein